MEKIGAILGEDSQEGDTILLSGDLGTGKTCFARGFIRARVGEPSLPVTSPSYLLDNTYKTEGGDLIIHHMDLYRLSGASDLHILDIPEVLQSSICLIEWPCRLGSLLPETRLGEGLLQLLSLAPLLLRMLYLQLVLCSISEREQVPFEFCCRYLFEFESFSNVTYVF
ncbi:unnamed protein product [Choristocarpus tenellus]